MCPPFHCTNEDRGLMWSEIELAIQESFLIDLSVTLILNIVVKHPEAFLRYRSELWFPIIVILICFQMAPELQRTGRAYGIKIITNVFIMPSGLILLSYLGATLTLEGVKIDPDRRQILGFIPYFLFCVTVISLFRATGYMLALIDLIFQN